MCNSVKESRWWNKLKDDAEKVTELNSLFCNVFVNNNCNEIIPNFPQNSDSLQDVEVIAEKVCNKPRKLNVT